ncbi:unnamed protein product [Danaus chrysippus]|uniref:(African queen) hypothetical protein n=1 Tax=Danaus chrysippus TaxID=151541 RepID=A0A8J2QYL8_9NEOP|nr:unnamed protein product [Danaus chrysippus]
MGAYGGRVDIGHVPDITEMTDLDKKASSDALHVLESMRGLFATGIMTIPPLDPYEDKDLKPLRFTNKDSKLITGQMKIQEVKVEGAKAFKINSLQLRMNTLRTDVDFIIPSLHGHVSFHFDLYLGGILPVRLDLKVNFNVTGISVVGALGTEEVDHEGKKVFQVQAMQGKFHADDIHLSLEGVGRKLIQDILNFLNESKILDNSPEVKFIKRRVNNYVAHILMTKVNKALEGFTVAQLKAYILG